MAVYAIGDVQGCLTGLQRLLERLAFDPHTDRLWFAGDLVNRGPQSLDVLRFVSGLGERAISVLGNHDLHLLALRHGVRRNRRHDTLREVLRAPDADALLDWLRRRPLLHHDPQLDFTLVHAGIYPLWSLAQAREHAAEVCAALSAGDRAGLFRHMYGDRPDRWSESLRGHDRLRFIINSFTRMRYCERGGRLDLAPTGPPGTQAAHLYPWFALPGRVEPARRILFGHWSTLPHADAVGVHALDTGCVWGGRLTALRLDTAPPRWTSVPCR